MRVFGILRVLLPIVSLVLGIIAITGSKSTTAASGEIYQIKLELKDMNITELLSDETYESLSLKDTGLSDVYIIGTDSYCRGGKRGAKSCQQHFFPDIRLMFLKEMKRFGSPQVKQVSYIDLNLPDNLPKLDENPWNNHGKAIHYCLIVALVMNGITVALFSSQSLTERFQLVWIAGVFTSFVGFVLYLVSAASSITLFSETKKSLNKSSLGIKATFGNSAFHSLLWCSFALLLLTLILFIISNRCAKPSPSNIWKLIKDGPLSPSDPEKNAIVRKEINQPAPKNAKVVDMEQNMKELYDKLYKYQMEQEEWEKAYNHHNEEVSHHTGSGSDNYKSNTTASRTSNSSEQGLLSQKKDKSSKESESV